MSGFAEREEVFRIPVLWLHERAGEGAVVRALGTPEPLNEAWKLSLPEFKEALRGVVREALGNEGRAA